MLYQLSFRYYKLIFYFEMFYELRPNEVCAVGLLDLSLRRICYLYYDSWSKKRISNLLC